MASAAIDHMISLTVLIAALLIFIGLFSQTMQTGIAYERHSALSTKTSDLLDTILLNPGLPTTWGQSDSAPVGFGLQDPAYRQYIISPFSTMRLSSYSEPGIYYPRLDAYYSNVTAGFGGYLYVPKAQTVNESAVSKLLGINGTYGFQIVLMPTLTISIQKISSGSPLQFAISVDGIGSPLANSPVSYSLITVNQDSNEYPSYTLVKGITLTDAAGQIQTPLTFTGIDGDTRSYALIVYSNLNGFKGMGYYVHVPNSSTKSIIPLIDSFADRDILLVHSDSVGNHEIIPDSTQLSYNASFVISAEDYNLRQIQLNQPTEVGELIYGSGPGQDYAYLTIPNTNGILIIAYKDTSSGEYGLNLMPWGLGSLAFPLVFGGDDTGHDWVTTDLRQITVGGITYQAKLELWEQSFQEIG
jgi:hypothetical protein